MHSEKTEIALRDILFHIDLASHFVSGLDNQTFRSDLKTLYAVTRCLEIISEASRRLPLEVKKRYPEISWTQIASAGNIYRHEYEYVLSELILQTVRSNLPILRAAVEAELRHP